MVFQLASSHSIHPYRMIYVGPGYSIVRPKWITPTFVTLDIVSIATQGMGSAFLFGSETSLEKLKRGRMILILGLFIQLVAFTVFLFFAIFFDRKTTVALRTRVAHLRPLMNSFYISGALILLRSIYRAVGTSFPRPTVRMISPYCRISNS